MDYLAEGIQLCTQGKFDAAINIFSKGIEQASRSEQLLFNRAKAYVKLDKLEPALADMDHAIAIAPKNCDLVSERGLLLYFLKRNTESIEAFDLAVEMEPTNPYRYSSRAFIKDRIGDTKGAIADYKKTLELDPEDAIAYNNLGLVYEKLGYQKEAKNSFAKADQRDPVRDKKSHMTVSKTRTKNPEDMGIGSSASNSNDQYLRTIKEVFTTKQGFAEFREFVKTKIKI